MKKAKKFYENNAPNTRIIAIKGLTSNLRPYSRYDSRLRGAIIAVPWEFKAHLCDWFITTHILS